VWTTLWVLCTIAAPEAAYAQRSLRDILKCKHHRPLPKQSAAMYLRSYPFRQVEQVEIPAGGSSLINVLIPNDVLSVSIQHLRNRVQAINAPSGSAPDAQAEAVTIPSGANKFFTGAPGESNGAAILHLRGNQITLFPRGMLIHPLVATCRIQPNDVVATLVINDGSFSKEEKPAKDIQALNRADQVHNWVYEKVAQQRGQGPATITLKGDLLSSEMAGVKRFEVRDDSGSILGAPPSNGETFLANLLDENVNGEFDLALAKAVDPSTIGEALVLSVVTRKVGPFLFRYVVPLQHAGAFSTETKYHSKLLETKVAEGEKADWVFDKFLSLPLIDGDVVEVSSIKAVPLFVQRAPLLVTPK